MEENIPTVEVPDENFNSYQKIEISRISSLFIPLIKRKVNDVKLNPENAFQKARDMQLFLAGTKPSSVREKISIIFMECVAEVMKDHEVEAHTALMSSNNNQIKEIVGLSSLLGYIFTRALVDYEAIHNWMLNILNVEENKFVRNNFIEIVKEKVYICEDEYDYDGNLKEMREEIEKYEEENARKAEEEKKLEVVLKEKNPVERKR